MSQSEGQQVETRLFAGFLVTAPIRYQLQRSSAWNEAVIAWQSRGTGLQEVRYQGKEYLGRYLDSSLEAVPTLQELQQIEDEIGREVKELCPALAEEMLGIWIFPHLLVS